MRKNEKLWRWVLSIATPVLALTMAYSGVIISLVRTVQGRAPKSEWGAQAEFLLLAAGPLVLGVFFLVALWWRQRHLRVAALVVAALFLIAGTVKPLTDTVTVTDSLLDMSPFLVYLVILLAHLWWRKQAVVVA